jgi:outer membrane receptor protein involved in Fe transport
VVVAALAVPTVALAQPSPAPDQQQPAPPQDQPAPQQPVPPQDQPAPPPQDQPASPSDEQPLDVIRVKGRVINALGRGIRGAHVTTEGAEELGRTDRQGYFVVKAPRGSTLVIDADGYATGLATVTDSIIDDVVLLDTKTATETIEVKGEAPAAAPGAAQLDRKELQRVPGTGGDVVRALTVMPGVVNLQVPLGYSGVVIRGSSPQDSKVLVDGFEIPVLYHNIGFRAVLPAEAIDTLDYIPGGFDVSYGRASSGIVALTTRPGSDKRTEQAEVSFIDGGVLAQGAAGDKTHYMVGVRRSTIDLILPSIIPASVDLSLTTVPSYYDEQFRIDHELDANWHLALSSVGTIDTFELYATKDTDAGTKRFFNRTEFIRLTGSARYNNGPWTANLALSAIAPEFIFEAGLYQKIDVKQPTVTPRAEVIRTWGDALGLKNVEWRAGTEAQVGRADLDLALPHEQREGEPMGAYDPRDVSEKFHGTEWVPDFAQWSSVTASFDPRVRFTGGLRLDEYARPGDIAIQPRGELKI